MSDEACHLQRGARDAYITYYDESIVSVGKGGWDFSNQLAEYGPLGRFTNGGDSTVSLTTREAEAYCKHVALTHYENFQVASCLIPKLLRQDFFNIYAYCRWSDDCADEAAGPTEALELLDWWQAQLDDLFAGEEVRHPVMVALRATLSRCDLPKQPFEDLLSAFRQDQHQLRYDSLSQLRDYCRRSADPVGRLVLGLAACASDAECVRLSDHVCTGLQIANFCQDMSRDAAIGRIYAPRDLWSKHAVNEQMLMARTVTSELRSLLRELVSIAREDLLAGRKLSKLVPRWLAVDVRLFAGGGLAILDEIAALDYDVWSRRPTVTKGRKLRLLMRAMLGRE